MTEHYQLIHQPTGRGVGVVTRAQGFWAKGWGVLGHAGLPMGEGLWLPGVASVHTLGVRFPLDLLFLCADFTAARIVPYARPGQWIVHAPGACHTLELGSGTLAARVPEAQVSDRWLLERLPNPVC